MGGGPIIVEDLDDLRDVAEGDGSGVGVSAVGDDLDVGAAAVVEIALEVLIDLDDEQDAALVDPIGDLLGAGEVGGATEGGGAVDCGEKIARGGGVILVPDGVGDVAEVEGGGVAEDEQLDDRRGDEDRAAARVFEDRQKLLVDQGEDALEGIDVQCSRDFWFKRQVNRSAMAAITVRMSSSGRMTPQTSPARNWVWSMPTK
jgi:hypothetical protein